MKKEQAERLAAAFEAAVYYASIHDRPSTASPLTSRSGLTIFRQGAIKELATALEEAFPESGGFILERPETRRRQKRETSTGRPLGPTP